MRNFFTHYWKNKTWRNETIICNEEKNWKLNHSASNEFIKRGVASSDYVYIVTNLDGDMFLGGRIEVDKILNTEQAANYLNKFAFTLWSANDHIVMLDEKAGNFTPDNRIPKSTVQELQFGDDLKPLTFRDGKLDQQTLRGVRNLSPESVALLDSFL